MKKRRIRLGLLLMILALNSCKITGPSGIFGKRSPHEIYGENLSSAGLKQTALGRLWFRAAEESLNKPLSVSVPYREAGYFPAEKPRATALRFEAKRGEKISITLSKKPERNFTIYVDLWEERDNRNKKLLAYADTIGNPFDHDIDETGTYIIRLQPELLASGEYTLTISNGPSLAFPVQNGKVGSFWGADRDAGARRHEGIDIFAAKRTPALAVADGTVNRVTVNKLGGKVVFLRPEGKNYSVYYAHLDEQLVNPGQRVKLGDTVGLVGNTGNAINTLPHLHLGIYTFGGAIDPLPFVNPVRKKPANITVRESLVGKNIRVTSSVPLRAAPGSDSDRLITLARNTIAEVQSATANWFKIIMPDGREGFIAGNSVVALSSPLRQLKLDRQKVVLETPTSSAAIKRRLDPGESLSVLGEFNNFLFVSKDQEQGG